MNSSIVLKKFEIIVEIEHLEQLIELLERSGVRGYTVIKNAGGLGVRGIRNPHDVLLPYENRVTIFVCKEELAQQVLDELRPAMRGFGGMCLISDCLAQTHADNREYPLK